jgi:hypothetical protein
LWRQTAGEARPQGRWETAPVALAAASFTASAIWVFHFGVDIFPGANFGIHGLGPTYLAGPKPRVFSATAYSVLELGVTITYLIILARRRRLWTPRLLRTEGVWLVALAISQLLLIPATIPIDRYYLPVVAPLVPLLLARLHPVNTPVATGVGIRAATLVLMAAGLGLYVVGQQDHEAWASARDRAALDAYQRARPLQVDAGYEANAEYMALPAFDATGHLPAGVDYLYVRPPHPVLKLLFAAPNDARPGVSYWSVAPGKIIVQPVK